MIWYILFLKLKKQISSSFTVWKTIFTILSLLSFGFYGFVYSLSIEEAQLGQLESATPENIFGLTLLSIATLTFLRMFLPNYTVQKNFFSKHYPITTFQNYHYAVVSDFMNQQFMYFALFILSASFFLKENGGIFLLTGFSVLISVQLLKRFIHYYLDNKLKSKSLIALVLTPFVFIFCFVFFKYNSFEIIAISLFIPLLLFFVGLLLENQIIETKKQKQTQIESKTNFHIKLILNNSKIKRPFIIALTLKSIVLVSDLIYFKSTGENLFEDNSFYYWLFSSPMMLFTYFLNNTWGFFKSTWLNYQIRTGNYSDLRKFTLKMMLFPITIDALISLPILLFRWDDSLFIVTFYLTSLLSLVSFSFLWSIAYPINIQNKIKKKGNSAFIGLIISFLTISLIASIRNNHLLYLVIPIFIIFSVLSYFLSSYLFSKKKYELFEKLSKE